MGGGLGIKFLFLFLVDLLDRTRRVAGRIIVLLTFVKPVNREVIPS